MIDLQNIKKQLHVGRIEVAASPKGILSILTRLSIWKLMIDDENAEWSYRARVRLNLLCVRQVLGVWYRAFPGNSGIEKMLQLASEVAEGDSDPEQAQKQASEFLQNVLFGVELNSVTEPATFVADAAVSAVVSACYRDPYYEVDIDGVLDDDDLLPDSLELSYSCSTAVAGGLNWQSADEVDVEARRAFWMWYLDDAVPAALRG